MSDWDWFWVAMVSWWVVTMVYVVCSGGGMAPFKLSRLWKGINHD